LRILYFEIGALYFDKFGNRTLDFQGAYNERIKAQSTKLSTTKGDAEY